MKENRFSGLFEKLHNEPGNGKKEKVFTFEVKVDKKRDNLKSQGDFDSFNVCCW
jgi:hypothetical protein